MVRGTECVIERKGCPPGGQFLNVQYLRRKAGKRASLVEGEKRSRQRRAIGRAVR